MTPKEEAAFRVFRRVFFAVVVFVLLSWVFNLFGEGRWVAGERRLYGLIGLGLIGYWLYRRRTNQGE